MDVLGYEADSSSHIQSIPRPIAALRVSKMKKKGPPAIKGGKESDSVAQESKTRRQTLKLRRNLEPE